MDESLHRIYLSQAKDECEECFAAIKSFDAALQSRCTQDLFRHARHLIQHAAAVSRIFWPPGGKNKTSRERAHRRGEALRKTLAIPANHPVQNRSLRDHFEHFDERLDEWADRSKNRNIIHRLLGPRRSVGGDAIGDGDIIHHYDPRTKVYAFRGEKFEIEAIATGVNDVYGKINKRLAELDQLRLRPTGGTPPPRPQVREPFSEEPGPR